MLAFLLKRPLFYKNNNNLNIDCQENRQFVLPIISQNRQKWFTTERFLKNYQNVLKSRPLWIPSQLNDSR
jgi:hypothetical protein